MKLETIQNKNNSAKGITLYPKGGQNQPKTFSCIGKGQDDML